MITAETITLKQLLDYGFITHGTIVEHLEDYITAFEDSDFKQHQVEVARQLLYGYED